MRLILSLLLCARLLTSAASLVGTCQTEANTITGGSGTGTASLGNTAGATLVVGAVTAINTAAVCAGTPMSDNFGNTYHCVQAYTATGLLNTGIWYAWDHGGTALVTGAGHTLSFQKNSSYHATVVGVFKGTYTTADPLHFHNGNGTASGSTLLTNSITPLAGDLVVSAVGFQTSATPAVDGSQTVYCQSNYSSGFSYGTSFSYQLVASGASQNRQWSSFGTVAAATIVSFRIAVAVGGAPVNTPLATMAPVETSTYAAPTTTTGDTQFFAWGSSAIKSGSWSGGPIFGTYNDGSGQGCGSSSACLYELLTYNSATPAATFGAVNTLTDYGGSAAQSCYNGIRQMKTRKPFIFDSTIFLPIYCMGNNYASSATSLTIGTGSTTFTTQTALPDPYLVGAVINIFQQGVTTNFMQGAITAYNSGTGSMTLNVTSTGGAGTQSSWYLYAVANPPFSGYQTGWIMSRDGGANWCNLKTFNAHATSPDCDGTNAKPHGDNPVDAAGFQFPWGDNVGVMDITNKMTRPQIVDFLCQDNAILCPAAPVGVDATYLYFMHTNGAGTADYLSRIPRSGGYKGVMLTTGMQVYNSGTWDSTLQNATAISGSLVGCCGSINWMKDFGVFATFQHTSTTALPFSTSTVPWGPFTAQISATWPISMQFPGILPANCPKYSGSTVSCTFTSNGTASGTITNFTEFNLGPKAPVYGSF